jgi:hypothetical protein
MSTMHRALAAVAGVILLAGCAAAPGAESPTPTPTAACPETVEGNAPGNCAPFDPDAAMAENERYRERRPLSDEQLADSAAPLEAASTALEPFALPGATVTDEAVVAALVEAGHPRETIQTLVAERPDGTAVAIRSRGRLRRMPLRRGLRARTRDRRGRLHPRRGLPADDRALIRRVPSFHDPLEGRLAALFERFCSATIACFAIIR